MKSSKRAVHLYSLSGKRPAYKPSLCETEAMFAAGKVGVPADPLDELAEVERRIGEFNREAAQLGRSLEAVGVALGLDASNIQLRGDSIAFDGHTGSSHIASAMVDLARIRNVVCNLKVLQAQRKQLQAQGKFCPAV